MMRIHRNNLTIPPPARISRRRKRNGEWRRVVGGGYKHNIIIQIMKRVIKFRGKRSDKGNWVEGDLVHNAFDGTSSNIPIGIKKGDYYPVEVIPESVGQLVLPADSEHNLLGQDIFENDILLYFGSLKKVVQFEIYDTEQGYFIDMDNLTDCEIIGNTIDNPELLQP